MIIYLLIYLLTFRQRGKEGERERKHLCGVVASHVPPTADLAHNPGMFPDWNQRHMIKMVIFSEVLSLFLKECVIWAHLSFKRQVSTKLDNTYKKETDKYEQMSLIANYQ